MEEAFLQVIELLLYIKMLMQQKAVLTKEVDVMHMEAVV
jgi:hypothetical protein